MYECGALQLHTPSLGFFITNTTLRSLFLGLVAHMMSTVLGHTVSILLPNLTIYYLASACDGTVDQVG